MWGTIIDVVFIGIVVVCAFIGIVKGLIDSILGLVSTGLALVGAVFLAKYVGNWVNKIFDLENVILGKLDGGASGSVHLFNDKINLSNVEVAKFAVWLITVVALFLLIKLIVFVIARIFENVTKVSPTISGVNRVLGMVFGAVKGAVIALCALAVCIMLGEIPVVGATINQKISETKVTSFCGRYVESFVENNLTKENIQGFIQKIAFEAVDTSAETKAVVGAYSVSSVTVTPTSGVASMVTKAQYDAELAKPEAERNSDILAYSVYLTRTCEFKSDFTFSLTTKGVGEGGSDFVLSGTWSYADGKITMTATGTEGTQTHTVDFADGQFILTEADPTQTVSTNFAKN